MVARGGPPARGRADRGQGHFDTEGVATTYGSGMFRDHVPGRDAEAVQRVRDAGAIVLGKTATHEFAWGFSSINDALGTVRNPRDPERVAGGSSGGSAAALRPAWRRWRWGRTPAARSACRAPSAAPTGSSRPSGVYPGRRLAARAHARPRRADGAHPGGPGAAARRARPGPPDRLPAARRHAWRSAPTSRLPARAALAAAHAELAAALGAVEVAFPEAELIVPAFRTIQLAEGHETHRRAGLYPSARRSTAPTCAAGSRWARTWSCRTYWPRRRTARPSAPPSGAVRARRRPAHARRADRPAADRGRARHRPLREAVVPYTVPQDLVGLPAWSPNGMQLTGPPGAEARLPPSRRRSPRVP